MMVPAHSAPELPAMLPRIESKVFLLIAPSIVWKNTYSTDVVFWRDGLPLSGLVYVVWARGEPTITSDFLA